MLSAPPYAADLEERGKISWNWQLWLQQLQSLFNILPTRRVVFVSAAYVASPGDVIFADTTAAGFTVSLPPAVGSFSPIKVIKKSSDVHTLTITANGADKINGSASVTTATQFGKFNLEPDNSANWGEF